MPNSQIYGSLIRNFRRINQRNLKYGYIIYKLKIIQGFGNMLDVVSGYIDRYIDRTKNYFFWKDLLPIQHEVEVWSSGCRSKKDRSGGGLKAKEWEYYYQYQEVK